MNTASSICVENMNRDKITVSENKIIDEIIQVKIQIKNEDFSYYN